MGEPNLAKLELQIMDALWTRGQSSIREIQESFPEKDRPAYTTVQTTVRQGNLRPSRRITNSKPAKTPMK